MGVVRRHGINFSIISYAGIILGYVNTVVLFPNILEQDQFGLTRILLSVAIVISQFAQLGTPGMIIRYYPLLQKKIFSIGVVVSTLGLLLVCSILLILQEPIYAIYEEKSPLFNDYFYLLLPFGVAIVYFNLFDSYLRALYKNAVSAFLSNILIRVIWLILIIFYSIDLISFEFFILAYACTYGVTTLISLLYLKFTDNPGFSLKTLKEERPFLNQIGSFNFFTLLAGISSFLINKVDILMLGSLQSLEIVAVYAIAAYMAMVIRVPASSIGRTAPSIVANAFKNANIKEIDRLYTKSALTQLILCAGIFILILINFDNILYVLDDEDYKESYLIFLFLGLTQVIDSASGINGFIMINSKYYKVEALFSGLLLLLTVITNLILIPLKGGEGAAIATLISITTYNILRLVFIQIKLKIQPFSLKTLIALAFCLITLAVGLMLPYFGHFILDAVIRTVIAGGVFLGLVYYSKMIPEINELVLIYLKKLKH